MTPRERQRLARLKRVYDGVPRIACRGLCHDACGVIAMTSLEARRLPLPQTPPASDACPLLAEGRCSAYADRPLICRLYGVVPGLPCPHGCEAEAVLTDAEAGELIRRVHAIGGPGVVTTHPDLLRLREVSR